MSLLKKIAEIMLITLISFVLISIIFFLAIEDYYVDAFTSANMGEVILTDFYASLILLVWFFCSVLVAGCLYWFFIVEKQKPAFKREL